MVLTKKRRKKGGGYSFKDGQLSAISNYPKAKSWLNLVRLKNIYHCAQPNTGVYHYCSHSGSLYCLKLFPLQHNHSKLRLVLIHCNLAWTNVPPSRGSNWSFEYKEPQLWTENNSTRLLRHLQSFLLAFCSLNGCCIFVEKVVHLIQIRKHNSC